MNKNEIYLTKRRKLIPFENSVLIENENSKTVYLPTILKNFEFYGYTLSKDSIENLQYQSPSILITWYETIIPILKDQKGFIRTLPMYPNFPQQVMDASMGELYINAIIHYMSLGTILPDYELKERFPLVDNPKLIELSFGTEDDFKSIFTNLLSSKSSISQTDKDIILWFTCNYEYRDLIFPDEIPMKEILAYISSVSPISVNKSIFDIFSKYYKTATDVLRFATAMSGGDESLATNTKFDKFNRKERKMILQLLEGCNNIEEDMKRYKEKWIALGKIIHPENYQNRYKKSYTAFQKIRNKIHIDTYTSKLIKAFEENPEDIITLLLQRPGEFGRRLEHLIRVLQESKQYDILSKVPQVFSTIANKIPTPLLLQIREHFIQRNSLTQDFYTTNRSFFPKGSLSKIYVTEDERPDLSITICFEIVQVCIATLIELYGQREPLGKVYIDEELQNIKIPTQLRNSSRAVNTLARGSKLKIANSTNTIRFFMYWREPESNRVDLDLSVVFYIKDFGYSEHISYTNPKNEELNCCHSGDITSAPNGASEYIDLDLKRLKENNIKYIALTVQSYTDTPFIELPEAFVGYMERDNANTGEIYEPKTVKNKIDLTAESQMVMPLIVDLDTMEIVWTDLNLKNNRYMSNNVEGNKNTIKLTMSAMLTIEKPNMYDMLELNARSRGTIVETKEEADIVFSLDGDISPYNTDIILSKYI